MERRKEGQDLCVRATAQALFADVQARLLAPQGHPLRCERPEEVDADEEGGGEEEEELGLVEHEDREHPLGSAVASSPRPGIENVRLRVRAHPSPS